MCLAQLDEPKPMKVKTVYCSGIDMSISLVDRAISAKANEYLLAKRSITQRENTLINEIFKHL